MCLVFLVAFNVAVVSSALVWFRLFEKPNKTNYNQNHVTLLEHIKTKNSPGLLRDLSGGYEICFYCMGVCMVLGSVPLVVVIIKDTLALVDKKLTLDQVA